jgi:hypothetical protein
MPEYVGLLQRLVLSRTLWLVVAWPIAGFAWQALVARPSMARARGQAAMRGSLASARNAGIACVALATVSTLAHAVVLSRAPEGAHALFQHVARGARFGQFDGEVDLLFDRLSATFCALACLVALGACVFVAIGPPPSRGWRTWAWLQLSLAGALVAFVADGFVGTAIGWAMAGAASAWLAGWSDAGAGVVAAMRRGVAIFAMLVGAVLLFWGLGGSWDGDDYVPDSQARFAAVRVGAWPDRDRARDSASTSLTLDHAERSVGASLTFTSVPGAAVFVDDARAPSMRSPFVGVPVPSGTHALRVHSGDGSNDDVLGRVVFDEGDEEVALVPFGPTFAFRAISDQLVLRDRQGDPMVRSALELRTGPGGATVVAASLVALLLAAGLMSGAPPSGSAPPALGALAHGATTAALGPYLLARLAFLFPLAPNTWVAVESVGAAILLVGGWRAPAASGLRRWLAFVGVAPAALACLALGAAGVTAATYVMVFSGAATAAFFLAAARAVGRMPERSEGAAAYGDIGRMPERSEGAAAYGDIGRMPERSEGAAAYGAVRRTPEDLLLVRGPVYLGTLLASMDRWVVSGILGTIGALVRVGAWVAATADQYIVAAPANVVSATMVRWRRAVEPMVGVTLARAAWALLALVALVVLAHALLQGR